jgi:NAD-dependent deacetylase
MKQTDIDRMIGILGNARSLLFITGAGLSADSGLPTYRGVGGLYHQKDTEEDIPIEEALSGDMLDRHPEITWKYISQIEKACRNARFNAGHRVIAEMERHFPRVWVLTQNIDGFHHQAGSRNIVDIHGNIHALHCTRCRYRTEVENYAALTIPAVCPECGAILRPSVILFGELLPHEKLRRIREEMEQGFDVVFSIGTTSVFSYIAEPIWDARRRGACTVEINPGMTEVTGAVDIKFSSGAAETLEAIWQQYQKRNICC